MSPLLVIVSLLLASTVHAIAPGSTVDFFNLIVNMTRNSNTSDFADRLGRVIGAPSNTVFIMDRWNLTASEAAALNMQADIASLQHLNITFVGEQTNAAESSTYLNAQSQTTLDSLGIVALTATTSNSKHWNETTTLRVTLAPNVTAVAFVSRVAAALHITREVMLINGVTDSSSSDAAGDDIDGVNVTLIGSHTEAIEEYILGMSSAQLLSLGANDVRLASDSAATSSPKGSSGGSSPNGALIIICAVLGGLVVAALLMVLVHWQRGQRFAQARPASHDVPHNKVHGESECNTSVRSVRKELSPSVNFSITFVPSPEASVTAPNPMV